RARVVESDDELKDPSNEGRSLIEELDMDAGISLVPPHAVDEGRNDDTQIYDLPAERRRSISTGSGRVSTASRTISTADVSTASELGSTAGVKVKDKGKAIMQEPEPPKKVKKRVQLDEREEVAAEPTQAQQINWSDPVVYGIKFNPLHLWILKKKKIVKRKESTKRQKIEDDVGKEELKAYLDLVPREEFAMEIESLATKYPIVDWKTHVLTENFMYYQIFRADGSSKNYKIFSEMLDDFDRQDGDLKILFEPDKEDEVWWNQHEYNLISWRLFDSCGIHILLMNNGISIHIMIEKKYPLTQEMLSKMLSRKLEVDHENEMAFELLRRKQGKETEVPQDETPHDESIPIPFNDPLLSDEDSIQLTKLMILCTNLQKQVLDLEKAKDAQAKDAQAKDAQAKDAQAKDAQAKDAQAKDAQAKDAQAKEITGLKKRVQKLERKKKSRTTGLKRLRKVGESSRVASSEDKENDLHDDEVIVDMAVGEKQEQSAKVDEREVSTGVEDSVAPIILVTTADEGVTAAKIDEFTPTNAPTTVIDELTLSQTLIEIKAAKTKAITIVATTTTTRRPKSRGVVVQEPSEFRTTTSSPQASQPSKAKDKGKAIVIEPEVPLKRKDQVALDEEMARNLEAQLQAKLIKEEKMERKKEEEANIALIESWENT
ncbi:hypothetical protein Tco_1555606, partial [Tanacetum coccineum]